MRKAIVFIVISSVVLILLLAMEHSFVEMNKRIAEISPDAMTEQLKILVLSFFLGIVFEWPGCMKLLKKQFAFNYWLVIPLIVSLLLSILPLFPISSWTTLFGYMFFRLHTNIIFGILSGILLIRMITRKR